MTQSPNFDVLPNGHEMFLISNSHKRWDDRLKKDSPGDPDPVESENLKEKTEYLLHIIQQVIRGSAARGSNYIKIYIRDAPTSPVMQKIIHVLQAKHYKIYVNKRIRGLADQFCEEKIHCDLEIYWNQ